MLEFSFRTTTNHVKIRGSIVLQLRRDLFCVNIIGIKFLIFEALFWKEDGNGVSHKLWLTCIFANQRKTSHIAAVKTLPPNCQLLPTVLSPQSKEPKIILLSLSCFANLHLPPDTTIWLSSIHHHHAVSIEMEKVASMRTNFEKIVDISWYSKLFWWFLAIIAYTSVSKFTIIPVLFKIIQCIGKNCNLVHLYMLRKSVNLQTFF